MAPASLEAKMPCFRHTPALLALLASAVADLQFPPTLQEKWGKIDKEKDWLEALLEMRSEIEVVVGVTTTPQRINRSLQAAIEGIFQQSVLPDRVVLSLPRGRMRFRASTYPEDHELPLFLQFPQPGLVVDRDCKDMGPGTVFFNGLKHAKRRDAFFMNTPDDHVFSKNHIAMLLQFALANPGTAVASLGIHSHSQFRPCFDFAEWTTGCVGRINLGHTMGPINSGFIGHMVQPWFFGEVDELAPDDTWPKECHMHDDLWLSSLLARRGIRREAANLGLPGKAKVLNTSKTPDALFSQNAWNLNVCNHALLDRFPGLWTPRPRIVIMADSTSQSHCVGHVDDWYPLPSLSSKPSTAVFLRHLVLGTTRHENPDTVVLAVFGQMSCGKLSAALQCAVQRPGELHEHMGNRDGADGALCLAAENDNLAAAATVRMWHDAAPVDTQPEERACWSFPNATWGRCCAPFSENWSRREIRATSLAKSGFDRELRNCPKLDSGCCKVHARLSRRWKPLSGEWRIEYSNSRKRTATISEEGLVSFDDRTTTAASSVIPRFRLEETANPSVSLLKAIHSSTQAHLSEYWFFAHGQIHIAAADGDDFTGLGIQLNPCHGCV